MERLHATIEGSVQGVGFRYWAVQRARALGLTGWVRNLADGSVETVAEGSRDALVEFMGALRTGPRYADVETVQPTFESATGEFSGFNARD